MSGEGERLAALERDVASLLRRVDGLSQRVGRRAGLAREPTGVMVLAAIAELRVMPEELSPTDHVKMIWRSMWDAGVGGKGGSDE